MDNPVDNVEITSGKGQKKEMGKNLTQMVISGVIAVAIALMHEYITQSGLCDPIIANPETAGPLGAAVRAVSLNIGK